MIKQPLKQYIQKRCCYNKINNDTSTLFKHHETFTYKFELIKDTSMVSNTISDTSKSLFIRYMNDDEWTWK